MSIRFISFYWVQANFSCSRTHEGICRITAVSADGTERPVLTLPYRIDGNRSVHVSTPEEGKDAELWIIEWEENGKTARNHYVTGKHPYDLAVYRAWLSKMFEL